MKKLSIALALAFTLGSAAPSMAHGVAGSPSSCMDAANAHYGSHDGFHGLITAPLWAAHALLCHVFHHGH